MKFGFFDRKSKPSRQPVGRPRYVSGIQKDVAKYEGWTMEKVEEDYRAKKSVHTILTLGYLEEVNGVLVLTEKGKMLLQNVREAGSISE